MNSRNSLILALVFATLATAAFYLREQSAGGGSVTAFRTTKAVTAGQTLGGGIERISIPKSSFATMATQVPTGELADWVGTSPLVRNVPAGTVVTFDLLMKAASGGLPGKLSKGMRAVSINISEAQAVAFLIRPGDFVDILATRAQGAALYTEYVLQAKKILAVDQNYEVDSAAAGRSSFSTVTLEVTPAEAQKVEQFRIQLEGGFLLALRPTGDTTPVDAPPLTGFSSTR